MILKKVIYIFSIIGSWVYGLESCSILDMIKPIPVSFQSVIRMPTPNGVLKYIGTTIGFVLLILILNRISQTSKNISVKKFMLINTISYILGFYSLFHQHHL